MISLLVASFVAGILTILAPCILPILPVIIGGSVQARSRLRLYIIVVSLCVSILLFTLLLKASTALLGVPQSVWQFISGVLLIGLGLFYLFPRLWQYLSLNSNASLRSEEALSQANKKEGFIGAILTGAALGPVFTSCSPTYLFIVAAILPANFAEGLIYLGLYVAGLGLVLLAVALLGARLVRRMKWSLNPHGWFNRTVGIVMILIGLIVLLGVDKSFQTFVIDNGWYAPVESIENSLR